MFKYRTSLKRIRSVILGWNGVTISKVGNSTTLLPNVEEIVDQMRYYYGIKIGSTSEFNREHLNLILDKSKYEGYVPDSSVSIEEVDYKVGPYMIYRNLELQEIYPLNCVVKVDNSMEGIMEGLHASCWTIAIADNVDCLNLYPPDLEERSEKSKRVLCEYNPHYVINSIIELPKVLDDINERVSFEEQATDSYETYLLLGDEFVDEECYFNNENKKERYNRNIFLL